MSRYIDLDEAKARTTQLVHGYEVEQWLDTIPSVDIDRPQGEWEMQEIVRCKECKYYKDEWCYWRDVEIRADDFCSYGERSE